MKILILLVVVILSLKETESKKGISVGPRDLTLRGGSFRGRFPSSGLAALRRCPDFYCPGPCGGTRACLSYGPPSFDTCHCRHGVPRTCPDAYCYHMCVMNEICITFSNINYYQCHCHNVPPPLPFRL